MPKNSEVLFRHGDDTRVQLGPGVAVLLVSMGGEPSEDGSLNLQAKAYPEDPRTADQAAAKEFAEMLMHAMSNPLIADSAKASYEAAHQKKVLEMYKRPADDAEEDK